MKYWNFKFFAVGMFILVSLSTFAQQPTDLQTVFEKMYPNATDVQWSKKRGYQIATFIENNVGINVWFTDKGKWVMTDNDVNSLEAVPTVVAEKFMASTLAAGRLRYVRVIDLPNNQPPVIIIDVQSWNSPEEFQVFYSPTGELLQTLNVTETGGMIYPGLFD